MRNVVALALSVVACGGGSNKAHPDGKATDAPADAWVPDPLDGTSGTRLKLVRYLTSDGASEVIEVHDAQLDFDCEITPWADGNFYCAPPVVGLSVVFSDGACAMPVLVRVHDTTTPPAYGVAFASISACPSNKLVGTHVYTRGSSVAVTQVFTIDDTGSCVATPATGLDIYSATEVPIANLAAVSLGAPTGTGQIRTRTYSGTDGFSLFALGHDNTLGVDCDVATYRSSSECDPVVPMVAGFKDPGCSTPVAAQPSSCQEAVAAVNPYVSCPDVPPTFTSLGITTTSLYESEGTCTATAIPPDTTIYVLGGNQVVPTTLQRTTETVAGRRLQAIRVGLADFAIHDYTFYDTMMQTNCSFVTQVNGTIECLPGTGSVVSLYSDASCGTPIDILQLNIGPTGCPAVTVPNFDYKVLPSEMLEVHAIGSVHTGALYTGSPGSCTLADTSIFAYYDAPTIVSDSEFVQATRIVDP